MMLDYTLAAVKAFMPAQVQIKPDSTQMSQIFSRLDLDGRKGVFYAIIGKESNMDNERYLVASERVVGICYCGSIALIMTDEGEWLCDECIPADYFEGGDDEATCSCIQDFGVCSH